MSPRVRAVLALVSEMTADERTELRDELEDEVLGQAEWTVAWANELADRMRQIECGEVQLLTEEEFFAE